MGCGASNLNTREEKEDLNNKNTNNQFNNIDEKIQKEYKSALELEEKLNNINSSFMDTINDCKSSSDLFNFALELEQLQDKMNLYGITKEVFYSCLLYKKALIELENVYFENYEIDIEAFREILDLLSDEEAYKILEILFFKIPCF